MSLKEDMQTDLDVFYDVEEFGISATYQEKKITLLKQEDYDFETFTGDVYTVLVSQMPNPQEEEEVIINGKGFFIQNFDFKDETKLEYIIGLVPND